MSLASYSSVAFTLTGGLAVAPSATIEVRKELDGTLASIFSDKDGASPISQPGFVADANGRFTFYAAGIFEGYKITITKNAEIVILRNVMVVDAGAKGVALMAAATTAVARNAIELPATAGQGFSLEGGRLAWTVASSVLTVAIKTWAGNDPSVTEPVYITFRSATAGDSSMVRRQITAATSIAINNTATLGTANSTAFRLWCVAFDDAGTIRLGVINCLSALSIFPLAGWGIASSVAEGDASDSAHIFYTGAAVTSKAYATLGFASWETGLATAGTWSAVPTRAQLYGLGMPLPGQAVQSGFAQTGAASSDATIMPLDDSIPQNTEGFQVMTQAITPTSAANVLDIFSNISAATNVGSNVVIIALFKDSVASALAAAYQHVGSSVPNRMTLPIAHRMLAGATTAMTFKTRIGGHAGNTILNGSTTGTREFGGVMSSFLKVEELMA
jgi:hypothetical protein